MGAADTATPDFQLGEGCLVDQLVGQFLADVAGLGNLLDPARMHTALQSVMKYNYRTSLRRHESVERIYALNDEAALLICGYGSGKRPKIPFPYFSEAWTGLEYAVAALMIYQGLVTEGLRVVESARLRHDGERRNPWNEPECGHHYARAMSAWGPLLALSGFLYDRPGKKLEVKPRIHPEAFSSIWSAGAGWGVFSQTVREGQLHFTLSVRAGSLVCRDLALSKLGTGAGASSATVGKTKLQPQVRRGDAEILVTFPEDVNLAEGDQLVVLL
jgi:hypothetical protein